MNIDIQRSLAQLATWLERFLDANCRNNGANIWIAIEDADAFHGAVQETGRSDRVDDGDLGMAVRNATEDLRNWYVEAASARPGGAASAQQLADWFWGDTAAGAAILALHPVAVASDNITLRHIGERALVPRAQQHRLTD